MRKLLEKIYHWLDNYLWDDKTKWDLECEIFKLKMDVNILNDSLDYYQDIIDGNESLRSY